MSLLKKQVNKGGHYVVILSYLEEILSGSSISKKSLKDIYSRNPLLSRGNSIITRMILNRSKKMLSRNPLLSRGNSI